MTRHSKNCTANSVYSYHEKKKDGRASGFGSLKLRFSKDGVKDYDCCCLSLHPCKEPVITTDGFLYEKEAILEYILCKKNEASRKMKAYEKQCLKEKTELQELGAAEQRSKLEKFLKSEMSVKTASIAGSSGLAKSSDAKEGTSVPIQNSNLPSFWIPALTPASNKSKLKKPDSKVFCPMSGRILKVKNLIPVKFTLLEDDSKSLEGKMERYKCPITGDALGNNVPCAVLRPTGDVVTMQCVELIKKDMAHPLTGQTLKESDIILLQRGGTGFASVNDALVAVKARPVMQT